MGKTRKRGVLGSGVYGTTYTSEALYNQLNIDTIDSLTLYTVKGVHLLNGSDPIASFFKYLKAQTDIIVKTYNTSAVFISGNLPAKNFKDELKEHRRILALYGSQAKQYLTIYPIKYDGLHILGAKIVTRGSSQYILFGHLCKNHFQIHIQPFLVDVLKSLVILEKAGYLHNDIKLDNIVLCNGRYKLIDWGLAGPLTQCKIGDMIGTNPIKWYLMGFPNIFTDNVLPVRTTMIDPGFVASDLFREVYYTVYAEYQEVIQLLDRKQLTKAYAPTFDVFMLGMLLLYILYKQGSNQRYLSLVKRFVSLQEPLTANQALALLTRKN